LILAVLSDEKRRALYDAGMYDPLDDDQEEVEVINLPTPKSLLVSCVLSIVAVHLTRSLRCCDARVSTISFRRCSRSWPQLVER
jgi:hypothetical protein